MASIKLKGDTSGEVTIQAPAVAGTTTLNLPATSSTLATQNALGVRNLIINGDMRIAQRGTSTNGITGSGYFTVDRWDTGGVSFGTWTMSQDTDVPSGQGFSKSIKWQCTTANTSLSANSFFDMHQSLEGQNLQHLKYGTSNAESLTLSFWVKSNKTGTYQYNLYSADNSGKAVNGSFTINVSDTWEKKTITYNGDTIDSLDNDNGRSLDIQLIMVAGSDYTGGTSSSSWTAWTNSQRAPDLTVNLADSTSNYINITGVQLEVGDTATPFEHRPYDMELARCQRYYEHNYNIGQTPGSSSSYPSNMGSWINGFGTHNGQKGFTSEYKVTKRATPSVTFYDTSGNSGRVSYLDAGGTTFNNQTVAIVFTGTSAILGTMGNGTQTGIHYFWVADSEL